MSEVNNPYSAGGGGWVFQTLVATHYAAGMLTGSISDLGGFIERLEQQTDTKGFDDIRLHFEPSDGGRAPLQFDLQCRSKQRFSGVDAKFSQLLRAARTLVHEDEAFEQGRRGLAIVVAESSPAHRELRQLCDLARSEDDVDAFLEAIARRKGAFARRWSHVQTAAGSGIGQDDLHSALRALHVRSIDIEDDSSPDRQRLGQTLANMWTPSDPARGGLVQVSVTG